MQETQIHIHQFPNGLVLLGESMPWLHTAAFSLLLPGGVVRDPVAKPGLATVTCEMVERGCGENDSRQFLEAVELLGGNTTNNVSTFHTSFSGSCVADRLFPLLQLYGDLTRRPHLPEMELEPSKLVALQELYSQRDDLAQLTLRQLRRQYFGETLGRWPDGEIEGIESLEFADVRDFYLRNYLTDGMVVSVAGNFDWDTLLKVVDGIWGDWQTESSGNVDYQLGGSSYVHDPQESQQTHIALAAPTVPFGADDYFLARCTIGILGDGMSSRLFQEVREKRGLCYTVFAGIHSVKGEACITAYAGTTAARAQETLDTMVVEFEKLAEGVSEGELRRLKTQIRTGLMSQQESCRSRASAIAGDWFYLGRVRSQDEINRLLEDLTIERVNQYLTDHPIQLTSAVTVGPSPLEMPRGVA